MREGRFVLGWVGSVIVANALAVTAASVLEAETAWAVLGVAALEGVCLGFLQRLVLRAAMPAAAHRWVLATLIGMVVGRGLQFAIDTSSLTSLSYRWPETVQFLAAAAAGATFGAVMAVPQAFALRGHIRHVAVWVVARAAGLAVAFAALFASSHLLGALNTDAPTTFGILLGVVAAAGILEGAIEGGALGRLLLRKPAADAARYAL